MVLIVWWGEMRRESFGAPGIKRWDFTTAQTLLLKGVKGAGQRHSFWACQEPRERKIQCDPTLLTLGVLLLKDLGWDGMM